ncbi:MAG: DUF4345 domain-containing protein [Lentisphaeraceae bacterium]|nr:DUF4345 domain-containing protein [Lentisphaeraceae bacterium]
MSQNLKQHVHAFVIVTAWMYILLGILFIINPSGMAKGLGFVDLSLAAQTDVTATYGGLFIGIGVYMYYLLKNGYTKLALIAVLLTFGGFALGRSLASIRFGGFYGLHCYWLSFELAYTLICVHFLKKHKSTEKEK